MGYVHRDMHRLPLAMRGRERQRETETGNGERQRKTELERTLQTDIRSQGSTVNVILPVPHPKDCLPLTTHLTAITVGKGIIMSPKLPDLFPKRSLA